MGNYRIITDSTSDLTVELVEKFDLTVIPMLYTLDGKSYRNFPGSTELDEHSFYEALRNGRSSTTAQVNSGEFTAVFTKFLEAGEDILYIAFSSGLSGTCQSANIAKKELAKSFPERNIIVFDSLSASMGEGLLVCLAAEMKKSGASLEEVHAWLSQNALKLCHWFTVDDLNHLKRGGRVSSAAAIVGTMLGIKPVLHVDNGGHLIPVAKIRGRLHSLEELLKRMEETAIDPQSQTVFISHADSPDEAEFVRKQVMEKFHPREIYINYIGPVIGAHAGPGTVALFFLGKER